MVNCVYKGGEHRHMVDKLGWPNEYSVRLLFWEIGEFGPHGFEPWSSQINYLKIYPCRLLARHLAILGYGKDGFAQCLDNVT